MSDTEPIACYLLKADAKRRLKVEASADARARYHIQQTTLRWCCWTKCWTGPVVVQAITEGDWLTHEMNHEILKVLGALIETNVIEEIRRRCEV